MKIFFMHIPKTAGSSLRRFLERSMRERGAAVSRRRRDGLTELSEAYVSYDEFVADDGGPHRSFDLICGHYPYHVRELLPPETEVVTVLRDPLPRCISHIIHQLGYEQQIGHPDSAADVNEFVAMPRNDMFLRSLANLCTKYLCYEGHPDTLVDDEALSVEKALANAQRTRLGFADELERFQQRLDAALFRRAEGPLPVLFENRSPRPFSPGELSPAARARLEFLNELDDQLCRTLRKEC